ncbi:hypothetical protein [Emticicia sp. BO119]|uniref:hypothetical protein n=1 Tax=Emticicia sp. BO119 TaxID=2757768 RepID=UPI0015F10D26|nr:hypothetical protein [Emticicia sp. BO119]MBA4851280.1 hypothetical protein [Emticicia sp. BO119]
MKISTTRFIIYFVVSALVFQFVSNSLLGKEVRLFPMNGDIFPGAASPITWKSIVSTIIFPIKYILLRPLSFLFELQDPPPPFLLFAFVLYWTAIAFVIYYLLNKIFGLKKA